MQRVGFDRFPKAGDRQTIIIEHSDACCFTASPLSDLLPDQAAPVAATFSGGPKAFAPMLAGMAATKLFTVDRGAV
jgi:hypothetical protein